MNAYFINNSNELTIFLIISYLGLYTPVAGEKLYEIIFLKVVSSKHMSEDYIRRGLRYYKSRTDFPKCRK